MGLTDKTVMSLDGSEEKLADLVNGNDISNANLSRYGI